MLISEMQWYFNEEGKYYFAEDEYEYSIYELKDFFADLMKLCKRVGGIDIKINDVNVRIESGCKYMSLRHLMKSVHRNSYWHWGPITFQAIRTINVNLKHKVPESEYDDSDTISMCSTCHDKQTIAHEKRMQQERRLRRRGIFPDQYLRSLWISDSESDSEEILPIDNNWNTNNGTQIEFAMLCASESESESDSSLDDSMYASSECPDNRKCGCGCDDDLNWGYLYEPTRHFRSYSD